MSLVLSSVSVNSDGKQVVSDISMSIAPGRITAVLGANGTGKSELVLGIAGVLPVTSGQIHIDGDMLATSPDQVRLAGVAAVPEGHRVLTNLSVDDNLRAAGTLTPATMSANLAYVYAVFPELAERKNQRAGTLSGGQQQMVALGHALMSRPKYLMVDEMSLGLAPLVVKRLMGVATDLAKDGVGILMIEQFTDLALQYAHYAVVLSRGTMFHAGPPAGLKRDPNILKNAYLGAS